MSSEEVVTSILREDLINTAVNFLCNPNVRKAAESQKEDFLRRKGLTDDEIRVAFQRSDTAALPSAKPANTLAVPGPYGYYYQMTPFQRFRDIMETVALFSGLAYSLYYLYKNFIAPYLFGRTKRKEPMAEQLTELKETVTELKGELAKLQDDMNRMATSQAEQQQSLRRLAELKVDIATVKGILLSRHQFPSAPSSIPAWQLSASVLKDKDSDNENEHTSSEIEIQPNSNGGSQNSDSSLEMIKEVEAVEAAHAAAVASGNSGVSLKSE